MKEGWEYKKLGNICNILNGFAFKSSTYVAEGIRVIRISNVQKGIVEDKDPKFFPLSCKREIENYLLNEGDLLISLTGNVGRVGFLYKELLPAALNQRVACLRLKDENIKKQYLFHFLNSNYFEDICIKNSKGAAQLNMSTVWLSNYAIPIPPLSEQQSIVDYLDSAFAKIDAMKANAEKALNEAKALFQASLKEMLEPKEGWEEKKLKEVVVSITDGDHQPPPKSDDGIPFITISNIEKNSNKIDFGETFYVPQSYYCALKKDRIPQKGDVLYTVTGSFGIPVLIDFQKEFCFQRHIALIRPNMGLLSSTYLFYWILSSYATSQAEDTATGAAQRTVSLNSLRNFTINFPPLSDQQSIVATLDSLKSKVDRLQENYDKISQECDVLKQAILRQVFE